MIRFGIKSFLPNNMKPTYFALAALLTASAAHAAFDTTQVAGGKLRGVIQNGIASFKGIPFAAPPVGDLRWRAPQPPAAWQGVRAADHFEHDCMQRKSGAFGPWSAEFIAKDAMEGGSSEDCLYLNVWTGAAKPSEKRPVFVWIYGGGFNSGGASVPVYDGEGLASKGLVVVVINYRVGIFGFMAHPELTKESGHNASGNYGLLDMVAALHWVKSNIGAFGGDASNVTIAGQSAGAFAVNYLVASPLTKGLFNRAIAESGGVFNSNQTLQQGEANGVAFQQKLGAANLKEMRAKSADVIQNGGGRGPIVDGYVISKSVADIFAAGEQNDVPAILGWNADDGTNFNTPPTPEAFRANATRMYGDRAEDFLKVFPSATQAETTESQRALSRIPTFAWQSHAWAEAQSKSAKSKVYLYFFNRTAPGTPEQTKYGAHHTGEVPYALNTLAKWDRPFEPADRKLADEMSSYWVNFAKTGNPNGKGLPAWPAYSPASPQSMEMSTDLRAIPTPDQARFGFFDAFYSSRRAQR